MRVDIPAGLTVAGSDTGAGAGVQADLRVMAACGVHPLTVITALTAQNLDGVRRVEGVAVDLVEAQLKAVLEGFEVRAVKTGMLWSAATVSRVAEILARRGLRPVVDPVMISTSGARLLDAEGVEALRGALLPMAALVTPNIDEACALLALPPGSIGRGDMADAAAELARLARCPVLLKGGHLSGEPEDLLWDQGLVRRWRRPRAEGVDTHGTGCVLSAAIAARLAHGDGLEAACDAGLAFVDAALRRPHRLASGVCVLGIERALDGQGRGVDGREAQAGRSIHSVT